VQKGWSLVEVRLVPVSPLSDAVKHDVQSRIAARLPAGMQLRLVCCESIPRAPSGKHEEFISEIPVSRAPK
jgi:hypothetical protein